MSESDQTDDYSDLGHSSTTDISLQVRRYTTLHHHGSLWHMHGLVHTGWCEGRYFLGMNTRILKSATITL